MKRILFALIFFVSSSVWADWTLLGTGNTLNTYVDIKTIKITDKTVKYWDLTDYKNPQILVDKKYLSMKTQVEINCSNDMYRRLYLVFSTENMGYGEIVFTTEGERNYQPIAPQSLMSVAQDTLCP